MPSIILHPFEITGLLSGRISQIRRPVVPTPTLPYRIDYSYSDGSIAAAFSDCEKIRDGANLELIRSPFGKPGDVLIGKETWLELRPHHYHDDRLSKQHRFENKGQPPRINGVAHKANTSADGDDIRKEYGYVWKSPATMPPWASRFHLTNQGVRVERANAITEEDAVKCGMPNETDPKYIAKFSIPGPVYFWQELWSNLYTPASSSDGWAWVVGIGRE